MKRGDEFVKVDIYPTIHSQFLIQLNSSSDTGKNFCHFLTGFNFLENSYAQAHHSQKY